MRVEFTRAALAPAAHFSTAIAFIFCGKWYVERKRYPRADQNTDGEDEMEDNAGFCWW